MAAEVQAEENKGGRFYERLVASRVVTQAMNQTAAVYNTVKNKHPVTQYACSTGESVVQRVKKTALNVGAPVTYYAAKVTKPLVGNPSTSLDPNATEHPSKVDFLYGKLQEVSLPFQSGLTKLKDLPVFGQYNVSQILESTVDLIKGKANDCYETVNNNCVVQFTNARINEAISLSEVAVEVVLPADPNEEEDVEEIEKESLAIKKGVEAMEEKGHVKRVVALGKRIQRRGTKKLMTLRPVQITYDSMVSIHENMTSLIHRSKEAGKAAKDACLVIPSLALNLTGEAVSNTKQLIIAITHTYSLNDIPGSVVSVGGKVVKPVTNATGLVVGQLLLPPRWVADYILSSTPIQFLIPNVVSIEETTKSEMEAGELAEDSDNDDDENKSDEEEELET